MIPRRLDDGVEAKEIEGGWALDAENRWVVEGAPADVMQVVAALGSVASKVSEGVATLRFGNGVGRYRAGPLGVLSVNSGKWTESHYHAMLDGISRRAVVLPFHAGAPSALPFSRSELDSPDVLYHAFVWLRHVLLEGGAPLLGALHAIVNDPHRRMVQHERLTSTGHASRLSARAIDDIAAGARPLYRVAKGRGLGGSDVMPAEITETVAMPSVDTAENRFVLALVRSCGAVVDGMRTRMEGESTVLATRVRADCDAIDAELTLVLRHRVWEGVGPMHFFPAASTVLQRRSPYREALRHHVLLRMASKALPLDAKEVTELLEVKDIARLYELWTAFAVIEAIRQCKGEPRYARRIEVGELGAKLGAGLSAGWEDGTEVAYNVTYSTTADAGQHGRSWSVPMRPDVTLWIATGPSVGLHLFDAKFRLEGTLGRETNASAKVSDLHKMHAYRDAILDARSAWVMYPGTEFRAWSLDGCEAREVAGLPDCVDGIGAVPVVPGSDEAPLREVIKCLLGQRVSSGLA